MKHVFVSLKKKGIKKPVHVILLDTALMRIGFGYGTATRLLLPCIQMTFYFLLCISEQQAVLAAAEPQPQKRTDVPQFSL